jgi:PiT family inorganic phosphate transporter
MSASRRRLLILLGPTAVGKTDYSITLARKHGSPVISCDARQIFRQMAIGTAVGGKKIIKTVGMSMVKLEKYQGFAASLSATTSLLVATLTGLPVSTTHTKTAAIMGAGAAKDVRSVNWAIAKDMVLTWVCTFPGCGLIGFVLAKLFLFLF